MHPGQKDVRKSRGFSLNDAEMRTVTALISKCALEDKTDLLLALCEAAETLNLLPVFSRELGRIVLRPNGELDWKPAPARGQAKK